MDDDVITAARALATLVVESGYYWWGGSVGIPTYCRYCGTHHGYRHSVACPLACAIVALLGDIRPDEFPPAALHCKLLCGPDEMDDAEFSTWMPNVVALRPVLYEDEPDAGT